jgi:hypothetical protein
MRSLILLISHISGRTLVACGLSIAFCLSFGDHPANDTRQVKSNIPIDPTLAARYFQEAKWISDDDGGRLWGKQLYGPIIFVDPGTRTVVANQGDRDGKLTQVENSGVWTGTLPKEIGIANTALQWSGVHWSMIMWPISEDSAARIRLILHECWHRIQGDVGLPSASPSNKHLDTQAGRSWLRLEWRALAAALTSWGPERTQNLTDALSFRAYRRSLFPGSGAEEDRMEVHEGMAEYTGVRLMGLDDWGRRSYIAGRSKMGALKPSYPLSFAYETGPTYGLLIEMTDPNWRAKLKPESSLSDILRASERITLPTDLEATVKARAAVYGGPQVFAEEEKREQTRLAAETRYRNLLVEGPVLELPLRKSNYTYNPNEVFPLGADGTVYPVTQMSDDWGVLEVSNGARVNAEFTKFFVTAPPSAGSWKGEGWKLMLKPGWKIVNGTRKGDFKVVKD